MSGIIDLINTNNALTVDMIKKWEQVITILKNKYIISETKLDAHKANMYKGDLYGLYKFMGIDEQFIYPYMRVNGYTSSREFTGDKLDHLVINQTILQEYITLFNVK